MNASTRIIVNTGAQYGRAIICALLSLYSTRLILNVLGMSDYGIYTLIAGVVALLGFITNALVITTQRYLSYHRGQGDTRRLRTIFANSLMLHIGFAIVIGFVLLVLMPWLFGGILNIEPERISVAKHIYRLAIVMLQLSILIAPFKACYIAHENIVYISLVEVADALVRVGIAIGLTYITMDKLLFYGLTMAGISALNLMAFAGYAFVKYDEVHVRGIVHETDRSTMQQLLGFAGWTTYGMGCIVARNQGLAIVMNTFFGTIINASFGIGAQVYGSIAFISTSIVNAFNPQIMAAEGTQDRARAVRLAEKESKFSEMLLMLLLTPVLFEMPAILHFWLGIDNDMTTFFCRIMLITLMCDQLTYGLNAVNQAVGKIRNYTLLMYTPKLLILPIGYILLRLEFGVSAVMYVYVAIELLVSLMRLLYMRHLIRLDIMHFVRHVFCPLMALAAVQIGIGWSMTQYIEDFTYRFAVTLVVSILVGACVVYHWVLDKSERQMVWKLCEKIPVFRYRK